MGVFLNGGMGISPPPKIRHIYAISDLRHIRHEYANKPNHAIYTLVYIWRNY